MRKAGILVAAEQLFRHYGFSKTTVADIAREAGIGVGTVYLEFPSKDAIASALAQRCRESVLQSMQAVIESGGNYSERLLQLLEARLSGLHAFIAKGMHGPDVVFPGCAASDAVNLRFARAEQELVSAFLDAGNQAGAFGVADTPTTARIILKTYDAICPPERPRDGETREELATLHALVLGGVLSRG
jgi:AcrR family transcriptional regulator